MVLVSAILAGLSPCWALLLVWNLLLATELAWDYSSHCAKLWMSVRILLWPRSAASVVLLLRRSDYIYILRRLHGFDFWVFDVWVHSVVLPAVLIQSERVCLLRQVAPSGFRCREHMRRCGLGLGCLSVRHSWMISPASVEQERNRFTFLLLPFVEGVALVNYVCSTDAKLL